MKSFLNPVFLACYEGDDAAATAAAQATADADAAKAAAATTAAKGNLTQEQFNKALAEDRRKSEAKYKALLADQAQSLGALLETNTLSEQKRAEVEQRLEEVQSKLLSEKQLVEKKLKDTETQLTAKIKEHETKAKDWETRFTQTEIHRELQAAAVNNDAFNASQLVTLLKPMTKMVMADGAYKTVVEMEETVDGKTTTVQYSPEEAVKKMKSLPEQYGNLFKTKVVAGVGGTTTTGTAGTNSGPIDWKHLTQAQYEELCKTHPDLPRPKSARK